MKFMNSITGDVLEIPPPDKLGASVILLNGKVLEHVLYSDVGSGSVTVGRTGRVFDVSKDEFASWLIDRLSVKGCPDK